MHVPVEALLEHTTTKIVTLAFQHLSDCVAKLGIRNPGLAGRLRKPGGLEYPAILVLGCHI